MCMIGRRVGMNCKILTTWNFFTVVKIRHAYRTVGINFSSFINGTFVKREVNAVVFLSQPLRIGNFSDKRVPRVG